MATYIRLTDFKSSSEKEQEFFNPENRYEAKQEDFSIIPGKPITYWVSNKIKDIFNDNAALKNYMKPLAGITTGDNDLLMKFFWEVSTNEIGINFTSPRDALKSNFKWYIHNKGGEFRRWYGNLELVLNYTNSSIIIMETKPGHRHDNKKDYFRTGLTWSKMSSGNFAVRYTNSGCTFDSAGTSGFPSEENIFYIQGILNSQISKYIFSLLNPTLSVVPGDVAKFPIVFSASKDYRNKIDDLVQQNIAISIEDWNSRETSRDFTKNELIKHKSDTKIETAYSNYCSYWKEQHNTLHQNEEELNRLCIDIYELQDELTPDVALKDITILKNEAKIIDNELVFQADEIMKQFISYGVGVMFGRYSLDSEGLLIANMGQEVPTSQTFEIDDDNVIPVLEDDFFTDDIASRFTQFVKATFGEENLSENINFIEKLLGTSIRKYFVKGFYEDHVKRYKKRPIYWMISSPKKGFMTLIYMHRYTSDIFATIQNDYLREYIEKLENNIDNLQRITDDESNSNIDRTKATKEITKSNKILDEIIQFDRNSLTRFAQDGIEIDLDDGVKVNYCKFKDVLYPISGLCKK